jgi:glycine cleavage system aminomethyltransferase T
MSTPTQNYANHRKMPSPAFMAVFLILAVNVVWQAIGVFRSPGFSSVLALLVAMALIVVAYASRRNAQIVQDRLIRLEMRLLACALPVMRNFPHSYKKLWRKG